MISPTPLPFWHECRQQWQRLSCQDVLPFLPLLLCLQSNPAPPAATDAAQLDAVATDVVAEPPYVRVIGSDSAQGGRLISWSAAGPKLENQESGQDWLVVDFLNPGKTADAWTMQLNDGSWLPGQPAPLLGDKPAWQLVALPELAPLPLDTLWLKSFGKERHPVAENDQDQLWVNTTAGGIDRQRGYLLEWGEKGLLFETSAGEREFAWNRILGLGLLEEQMEKAKDSVWIQLANGGVLAAQILSLDKGIFDLQLAWGDHWKLPVTAVQRVRRRSNVEEWASAEFWQVESSPASKVIDWSPRFGKSVEGRPMRLGSSVFAQGIGVMVPTTLSRAVEQPGLLLLTVGVDKEVEFFRNPQPVVFEVWLNDEKLSSSGPRLFSDPPMVLKVPLTEAGELKLIARPAGALPFGGHADFADVVWLPQPPQNP